MCNAYNVRASGKQVGEIINDEIRKLRSQLVRRGGPGVVLLGDGGDFRAETMRWGFDHPKYKLVNNARGDSLPKRRGMWWEPMEEGRRCLVPVASFYEWGEAVAGVKPAYEFSRPDEELMWVAGLYERTAAGAHYATITTEPTAQVAPFHDRLLAILEWEDGLAFLQGERNEFPPYGGSLRIEPCASPLKRKPPEEKLPPPAQGELF